MPSPILPDEPESDIPAASEVRRDEGVEAEVERPSMTASGREDPEDEVPLSDLLARMAATKTTPPAEEIPLAEEILDGSSHKRAWRKREIVRRRRTGGHAVNRPRS